MSAMMTGYMYGGKKECTQLQQTTLCRISWAIYADTYNGVCGKRSLWVDTKLWACCEPSFSQKKKEVGQEPGSSWE
jgi:hypothetical protein